MEREKYQKGRLDTGTDGVVISAGVTIANIPADAVAWKANAILMWASPKLLTALINLTERVAKTRREAGELAILDEWEAANAIIAEATGSKT